MSTITSTGGSGLSGMMKERYLGTLNNTILRYTKVYDLIQESNIQPHEGSDGLYYKLANIYGGMQGIGARLENSVLPEGGNPMFVNPLVKQKYNYGRVDATWQAIRKAEQGPAAFASFAAAVLKPTVENLTADLDRQACGYGAGILARVDDASVSATALGIDAPFGIAGDVKGWITFQPGMKVVFGPNADGSGLRSGGQSSTVLNIDKAGNAGGGALDLDSIPGDVADDDYIFRGDAYGANVPVGGEEPELMGMEGLIDDGTVVDTLENISRSTVSDWESRVIAGGSAPYSGSLTEGLLMTVVTDAELYGNGRISAMLTSNDCLRQGYNAIRQLGGFGARRDGDSSKAGTKGISVLVPGADGEITVRGVPRLIPGRLYGLDLSTLMRFTLGGQGEWVDWGTGSIWQVAHVGAAVKDAAFAYYRHPLQLGIQDPKKCVKVTGISETAY